MGRDMSDSLSTDIYLRCRMEFTSNTVGTEAPDFVHLGIPADNALDEFNPFSTPTTRVRRLTDGSHCSATGSVFGEVAVVGMSRIRSEQNYSYKTDFLIRRGNQDFGLQNNSMSRPPFDLTPIGMETTNGTTSPID